MKTKRQADENAPTQVAQPRTGEQAPFVVQPGEEALKRVEEGTVRVLVAKEGTRCVCCSGPHVFAYGADMDRVRKPGGSPRHPDDVARALIREALRDGAEAVNGRRIRVTVEWLEARLP